MASNDNISGMPKKSKSPSDKEVVRITFRLHGAELEQLRQVRDMLSLNAELDAARYLMQRGLEAMSATLASRNASNSMVAKIDTTAMVKEMAEVFAKMEADAKSLVKDSNA